MSVKIDLAAAVLCGGRGERLRPLTDYFQKTMIPIGEKKRPLLEYIVRLLAHHGVSHVAMLVGYRMDEIRNYFRDGAGFGVKVTYSKDPSSGCGSLGALSNALRTGKIPPCETLVVYYGDILSDLDITELVRTHREQNADATLVLSKGYTLPVGVAEVKGHRVVRMQEKPRLDVSVTMGCMTLGQRAMRVAAMADSGSKGDLMSDFVPKLLRRKFIVAAYHTKGIWHDVGTITSFEKANAELRDDMLSYL